MIERDTELQNSTGTAIAVDTVLAVCKPAVLEIKHCTECPYFERKRMWTEDSWEEAYDWFCKKENNKKIQGYVEWNEEKDIKVPDWCPLRK